MQLFVGKSVRRFVGLALLLFFAVPFGLSVTGCKHAMAVEFCNSSDAGPVVGQVANITLPQNLLIYGESLNYGQIGQSLSASATDCKGNSVSVSKYVYASTNGFTSGTANQVYADIDPGSGRICAGTWNRNSGGGIPDYTTCTAPPTPPTNFLAYVTATAEGATSDAIPVFVHSIPSGIQIVNQSSTDCTNNPTSDCCPLTYTAPLPTPAIYSGTQCISQGVTRRLIARVLDTNGHNITCQVGHLTFSPLGATNIVTIDENGVATANQPGSATITASVAGSASASTAGFFSTCPPAIISLSSVNGTGAVVDTLGTSVPFTALVSDSLGNPITGLALQYETTSPSTIPAGSNNITPTFPGSATITAICQPPSCNPSAFAQIDYLGNGTPLTSNGIQISAPGSIASVLYVGSTSSQYLYPMDFTTNQPGALLKLPYVPNSMVIDPASGSSLYLGSSSALMTVSTATNSVTSANTAVTGSVISVSPDGGTLVVTDPVRQTVSLISSSGAVETSIAGVAIRAAWAPDAQTVYITTQQSASYGPQILVHNTFTSWTNISVASAFTDVTVTVPHIGAYFAGSTDTQGRSYCPTNTLDASTSPAIVTNSFYQPPAQTTGVADERIAATDDSNHILAAQNGTPAVLNDLNTKNNLPYTTPCLIAPTSTPPPFTATNTPHPLTGVTATHITGVVPASNSAAAFVTYTGTSANPAGILPIYFPASSTVSTVPLSGAATDPVAGVFTSNDAMFFVGTAGDNKVHEISLTYPTSGNPTAVDLSITTPASIVTPNLPDSNGNIVTPNLIAQRPKRPTT